MQVLSGVQLVLGAQRLQNPQTTGAWAKLRIANESPYNLTIQVAGATHLLDPQTADVYALNGANFIDVNAVALLPVAGAPSTELELTYAQADETIPGTYPMSLTRETSGSTTFTNASIGVVNAPGSKITSSRPPQELGIVNIQNGTQTGNFILPSDVLGLAVILEEPLANFSALSVKWHPATPGADPPWVPLSLSTFAQPVYVVPILPTTRDINGTVINSVDLSLTSNGNVFVRAALWALFETAPEWQTFFAQLTQTQRPKAFDTANFSQPGAGVRAAVVLAAVVGKHYVIKHASGRVAAIVGGDGATFEVGVGTGDFVRHVTQTNGNVADSVLVPEGGWPSINNSSALVAFLTAPQNASNFQSVAIGAYLEAIVEPPG